MIAHQQHECLVELPSGFEAVEQPPDHDVDLPEGAEDFRCVGSGLVVAYTHRW